MTDHYNGGLMREEKWITGYKCVLVMFALMALCIVIYCVSAFASEVTVQGGWQHTQNSNYGDGASINARVTNPLLDDLKYGVELGYHGPTSHYSEESDGFQYGDLSGYSVLGELVYYPIKYKNLNPYILGGWGWSWWNFSRSQDVKDLGISIEMGNCFAQKYGIGVDYEIDKNWSFNIEWYWFRAQVPKDARERDGRNSIILTDEKTLGQEETCLVAGVKYSW